MSAFALISVAVICMSIGILFGAAWACRGHACCKSIPDSVRALMDERHRQIHVEQFDDTNDDAYPPGELALAASAYALSAGSRSEWGPQNEPPRMWPWPRIWWKPRDRRRDLVRAGALILAELDRMERVS